MLENLFPTLSLTAEAYPSYCLSTATASFLGTIEFHRGFYGIEFITQVKIEFLQPFTGCRKVLGKMPDSPKCKMKVITYVMRHISGTA